MSDQPQRDWNRFRGYLRVLAASGLDDRLQAKLDPSDIVQQTLVDAVAAEDSFRGTSEAEMRAWLRRILVNNLARATREHTTRKRDVARERAIQASVEESAHRGESILAGGDPTPPEHAEAGERVLRLYDAVGELTDDQRTAIELHYWRGLKVTEIAARMDRTVASVGGLLKRGLKALREHLRRER